MVRPEGGREPSLFLYIWEISCQDIHTRASLSIYTPMNTFDIQYLTKVYNIWYNGIRTGKQPVRQGGIGIMEYNSMGMVITYRGAHSAGKISRDEMAGEIKELIQIVNTTSLIVANQIIDADTPDKQRAIAKYIDTRIAYDQFVSKTQTQVNALYNINSNHRDRNSQ